MPSKFNSPKINTYNNRLFDKKGLRSWVHNSRFHWFRRTLECLKIKNTRVIEIGCFDGRLLAYLPESPARYEGFDAGWEGGLSEAQVKYAGSETLHFHKSDNPSDLSIFEPGTFDIGVAMETIEHIPPHLVDGYLEQLARVVDGYLLITVPNEKGIIFLLKWLAKKVILSGSMEKYTLSELIAATFGKLDKVERNEHKGFDYDVLVNQIGRHFDLKKIEGTFASWLPVRLAVTVAIIAKSKDMENQALPLPSKHPTK